MRRVVVTGMGIVSCLGNDLKTVAESLAEGRSGIRAMPDYPTMGLRSHVAGVPQITVADHLDRRDLRFMGDAAAFAAIALARAIESSGLSAELVIPVDAVPAHRVSPAILTLGSSGEVGVKTVDDSDKVKFIPVEILREDAGGLWIMGLPEQVRLVVVGQDFVLDGQIVRPVDAVAPAPGTLPQ